MLWLSLGENSLPDDILKRHKLKSFSTPYTAARSTIDYALGLEAANYDAFLDPKTLEYQDAFGNKVVRSLRYNLADPIFEGSVSKGFEFTTDDILADDNKRAAYAAMVHRLQNLRGRRDMVFLYHHRANPNSNIPALIGKLQKFAQMYTSAQATCHVVLFHQTVLKEGDIRRVEQAPATPNVMSFNFYTKDIWGGRDSDIFWARVDDDLITQMLDTVKTTLNIQNAPQETMPEQVLSPYKQFSSRVITSLADIFKRRETFHYIYKPGDGRELHLLYKPAKTETGNMLVTFHGALRDRTMPTPLFRGYDWVFDNNDMIALFDPVLGAHKADIHMGWFLKTKKHDYSDIYTELAALIEPRYKRIIATGSSAGGLPALRFAGLCHGEAIIMNAQLNLPEYFPNHWNGLNGALTADGDAIDDAINAIDIVRQTPPKSIVVYQNIFDSHHRARHFEPFVEAMKEVSIPFKAHKFALEIDVPHNGLLPQNMSVQDYMKGVFKTS